MPDEPEAADNPKAAPIPRRRANFDCHCGRPMVWVAGHAVCSGCEDFWPRCRCR